MTDESAFLRAICEAPAADEPRLVYADWLEEGRDPLRAELIRVQCELAKLAPRKRFTRVRHFTYTSNAGVTAVNGAELVAQGVPAVGEYVDVIISEGEAGLGGCKRHWPGVRVTEVGVGMIAGEADPMARVPNPEEGWYDIGFTVDEGSGPWPGEPLKAREHEILKDGSPDWGLVNIWRGGCEVVPLLYSPNLRRGMVEDVTVNLDWFLGGWPCTSCRGRGIWWKTDHDNPGSMLQKTCPVCEGRSVSPPMAADLFNLAPVLRLGVVGKEPEEQRVDARGRVVWLWYRDDSNIVRYRNSQGQELTRWRHHVPTALWPERYKDAPWIAYYTKESAQAAMSRWCVHYGRRAAGLPETSEEKETDNAAGSVGQPRPWAVTTDSLSGDAPSPPGGVIDTRTAPGGAARRSRQPDVPGPRHPRPR